ncbi:O-antigen ligase family protein [Deinococcus misasensis]|uniref:O-antigen ligase family protein n=1 Tax=Deinococcus misasensis TaxID=392413 RepID=UPI00068A0201|nr:O-antigen ligase family protein [Deinococcus misasensis]
MRWICSASGVLCILMAMVTVTVAPLANGSVYPWGMALCTFAGLLTLILGTLCWATLPAGHHPSHRANALWLMAVVLCGGWIGASTLWATETTEASRYCRVWLAGLGAGVGIHLTALRYRHAGQWVLGAVVAAGTTSVGAAYLQDQGIPVPLLKHMVGVPEQFLTGSYFHPSHYSGYLVLVAGVVSSLLFFSKIHLHTPLLLMVLLGVNWANFHTDGSSTPAVVMASGLPLLWWLWRHNRWLGVGLTALMLAGGVAGAGLLLNAQGAPTFEAIKTHFGIRSQSFEGFWTIRQAVWDYGWRMFQDAPYLGHGVGQFGVISPMYRLSHETSPVYVHGGWVNYAHNDVLQILSELGLVGLGLWLAVLLLAMVHRIQVFQLVLLTPLLIYLFTGIYDSHLTSIPGTMVSFYAVLGLAALKPPPSSSPSGTDP